MSSLARKCSPAVLRGLIAGQPQEPPARARRDAHARLKLKLVYWCLRHEPDVPHHDKFAVQVMSDGTLSSLFCRRLLRVVFAVFVFRCPCGNGFRVHCTELY